MGNERTDVWNGLDTSSTVQDGEVVSVYRVKNVKGVLFALTSLLCVLTFSPVPTMDAIEARIGREEANVQAASAHVKPAQFVVNGVKLETRQCVI